MNYTDCLERSIWLQLNNGIWPNELLEIKPKKWDLVDMNLKGKLVLDHFGQIIYKITLLCNAEIAKNNRSRTNKAYHLAGSGESTMYP
ncbi:MAG TPA: hypothetical protein VGJ90_08470 [Methylophilaceae bacterium]